MILVGLTGRAQHGKDTTGNVLVEEFGFTRYAFADALKSMALVLNPIIDPSSSVPRLADIVHRDGWEAAKQHAEVRRFLQVLGTEGVRNHIGDNAWVDALWRKVLTDRPERVVITDVRFPNEADFVWGRNGWLLRVVRPGFDNGLGTDHPSEAFVDQFKVDHEFVADDIDDLRELVRSFAKAVLP